MRIDVGGYQLNVRDHVKPKAKNTAILLHGLAGTGADWDPVLDAFDDCNVYAIDLIGHGDSDAPDALEHYRFDAVADSLVRLADQLGVEKPVWIGYSLGARVLLHFALRHPDRVRALVLESVHPGFDSHHAHARRLRQDRDDAAVLEREGLDEFFERWHRRPVFDTRRKHTTLWAREVERKRQTSKPHGLARCLMGLGVGSQDYLMEKAQMIDAPTLLMAGVLDPTYVEFARALRERIQNSRLELVHYAGHAVHIEDVPGYKERIRAFLHELHAGPWTSMPPPRSGTTTRAVVRERAAPVRSAATARQARPSPPSARPAPPVRRPAKGKRPAKAPAKGAKATKSGARKAGAKKRSAKTPSKGTGRSKKPARAKKGPRRPKSSKKRKR